jgi:hypothetical protein
MDAVVLYPEVGTRSDAASAGGSLHAKMGDAKSLLNTINANVSRAPWAAGKTPVWTYGKYSVASYDPGMVTIVNIAGPRTILGGFLIVNGGRGGYHRLVIDGEPHVIQGDDLPGDATYYGMDIRNLWNTSYARGIADYRFTSLTPASEYSYASIVTGGMITLPMMHINSHFTLEGHYNGSYNFSATSIYNILHTSV